MRLFFECLFVCLFFKYNFFLENGGSPSVSKNNNEDDDEDKPKLSKKQKKRNTIYFHLVLMLASCYMSMLFTNWGVYKNGIDIKGNVSVWANIGVQWVAMALFWQTLAVFRRESKNDQE